MVVSVHTRKKAEMGELSPIHWLVVVGILVLLFGGRKIPEVMKGLGTGIREFKNAVKEIEK
jgi:sec-independent protein translocase protein TatA